MHLVRLALLLLLLLPPPALPDSAPLSDVVRGDAAWEGEVVVSKPLLVASDGVLLLQAGTRLTFREAGSITVQGRLAARGTKDRPVLLDGVKAQGALITAQGEASVLEFAETEVTGGSRGLEVSSGTATLTSCRFARSVTGVVMEAKSRVTLTDVAFDENGVGLYAANGSKLRATRLRFQGQQRAGAVFVNSASGSLDDSFFRGNEVGVAFERASAFVLTKCAFEKNGTAADLRQSGKGPVFSFGSFVGNRRGIVASNFASPLVDACRFERNDQAFCADQFSTPLLRYCAFSENHEAVRFDKKSNGAVENSILERNEVALFADFSSYPTIRGNFFSGNEWHVRLGVQESMDFEHRRGSGDLTRKGAKEREKDRPASAESPAPLRAGVTEVSGERFSVVGNAWDARTEEEMRRGPDANVSRFWDGRDEGPTIYEGFGDTRYAVDAIVFLPFANRDQLRLGPEAWQPTSSSERSATDAGPAQPTPREVFRPGSR